MNKILRYVVYLYNVPQELSPSYNISLGKNALIYARVTAINYKGILMAENTDGTFTEIKNYQR